jgi:peptide/nickel transport system substrate-binding protein
MADEWTLSGDGKTWTIKIKEGIKFHSGETLTSEDVAFTINRAANPPEGITSRRAGLGLVESAKVAGPLTVSVKMSGANPDLIMDLAAPLMVIYRKAEVEPMDKALTRFMTAADGNGPFKLKESVRGQYYEAEAFDGYHEAGLPYLDSIKMYIVSDLNAMEAALRSNRLDLIHQLAQPDLLAGLESDFAGKITVEAVPWQSNAMCSPNQAKQFKSLDIRRAVNLAMDRDKALNVLGPSGIITYLGGIMPPAHPMALPEAELRKLEGYAVGDAKVQEVELAKKLIKDGGYEGMEFKILTRHGSLFAEAAAFMQDQLKVVGLKPSLEPVEPAIFYPRANAGDHDFACNLSLAFGVSTNAILEEFTMEGGSRWYGQWSDPEMKKRLYELETEVDAAKRKTLIYDYQRDFIERGYNVVMGFRLVDMEYWSYVKGLNMYSVPIAEQWYAEAWFAPR